MSVSCSSICRILDIPDEILVKIFLHFNASERVALANSCMRFNNLVCGDKDLLRDLDFSENGRLIMVTDIQQYFSNQNTPKQILRINIQNVRCITSGQMLSDSIGKAINLVDLNILGTDLRDVDELRSFLEPLVHLKRLSLNWPKSAKGGIAIRNKILEKPLSRLTYLSVVVWTYSREFLPTLQLCKELEELRMRTIPPDDDWMAASQHTVVSNKLKNLKIVQVRGCEASWWLKDHLMEIGPDPHKWTDFQLIDFSRELGFYLEKDVEICEQFLETELLKYMPYLYQRIPRHYGLFVTSEYLLTEVIKITHKDVPEKFHCLTFPDLMHHELCLLNINDAKQLLKDPEYQISFLHIKHSIEPNCDVHLIASAFPNLTELVLSRIILSEDAVPTPQRKRHFRRRLGKRDNTTFEEQHDPTNTDSSFKMLVENTPHLKSLTIYPEECYYEAGRWDLDALYLIVLWKNLRTLRLAKIPIRDVKFLIEIGKECPQLENVVLRDVGHYPDYRDSCCYARDLSHMLYHCRNLKEFSIEQTGMSELPELFDALSNNLKLRAVCVINGVDARKPSTKLISSIAKLLLSCPRLTTFVFIPCWRSQNVPDELPSALERIRGELKRPHLQFQTSFPDHRRNVSEAQHTDTIHKDASLSFFPCKLDAINLSPK